MAKSNKWVHKIAALCMCASILFTACGGSSSGSSAQGGETSGTGEAASPTVASDGILDVGFSRGLDSLTPFVTETVTDDPSFNLIYESLAIFDADKELQPWVAKSWNTEDNGFNYDVEIHEGVMDSEGNAITAADVVWFIQASKEKALRPAFSKVESVEQTGDYTFHLTLNSNMVGNFEKILTCTYVISQAAFEASSDEFGTAAITTSPYKVTEFTANSIIKLERRDDYWQDFTALPECVQPNVEKVTFHSIPEASQMGIALETGTIDIAYRIDSSTGAQFVDNSDYTIEMTDGHQGWQVFFSGAAQSPVAEDVKLRQAICYAIDAEGLVTGLCAGYGTPMYDSHSPIMIGYNPKWEDEEYYPYDVEKAKSLLAESNYNGETLKLLGYTETTSSRLAQLMQNYLAAVGIKVELNLVDNSLYFATRLDGTKYDLVINSIGGTYLSDAWAIRYDPAAYPAGDATSRNDQTLAQLLYETWTPDGYTEENIDKVHYYLKDNAISYGMVNPQNMCIWRNDIGLENEVKCLVGTIAPAASTYSAF